MSMFSMLERIIIIDVIKDLVSEKGNKCHDLAIVILDNMSDNEKEDRPHIEISCKFEERSKDISVGDEIALDEEKMVANIVKDVIWNSIATTYIMYDSHETIPFLDKLLRKHGCINNIENINILDLKTISRDRMVPPYTIENLASNYDLSHLASGDNLAIDNARLFLELLFKMEEEKNDLRWYINLIGFLDRESHPGFLPCLKTLTLPQRSNLYLKLYEGFDYDGYKFKSVFSVIRKSMYIAEQDSKFGIGILNNYIDSSYKILLSCDYDNILSINSSHQERVQDNEFDTFIFNHYFILVKDGKQALCRIRYNYLRPTIEDEYEVYLETNFEYDYISKCGNFGYLLQSENKQRYFSAHDKTFTKSFSQYKLVENYLMIWWEDGTYALDVTNNSLIKIADASEKHLDYIGSNYFAGYCDSGSIFLLKNGNVKKFEDYKLSYSVIIGRDAIALFPEAYIVVLGEKGYGVLNGSGEFVLEPKHEMIHPELLFTYLKNDIYKEKKVPIENPWEAMEEED